MILFPRWFFFNIHELSSWSRAMLMPLAILNHHRPTRTIAAGQALHELYPVGTEHSDLVKKVYEPGTTLHGVEVDGEQGYFLSGVRHLVYLAANDLYREERVRLAEDVLLWQHGPLLMRIEGRFTEAEALRIARSFH